MQGKVKRICPDCHVWWWATISSQKDTTDCPQCKRNGFYTLSGDGYGAAIIVEFGDLDASKLRQVQHNEEEA